MFPFDFRFPQGSNPNRDRPASSSETATCTRAIARTVQRQLIDAPSSGPTACQRPLRRPDPWTIRLLTGLLIVAAAATALLLPLHIATSPARPTRRRSTLR